MKRYNNAQYSKGVSYDTALVAAHYYTTNHNDYTTNHNDEVDKILISAVVSAQNAA